MALRDAMRFGRGFVEFHAQDVLASSEFQMMSLEERGRLFSEALAECPPIPETPNRYIPKAEREAVAERYGCSPGGFTLVKCPCGATGWIKWKDRRVRFVALHLDHVHPVSRGGKSDASNLQLLCPTCNMRKGASVVA